ncbi:putative restriction endonuclease [Tepidimonas alkaliphilus]|uniref:Putative restriction endonuclease n=1 Tax=Tepidimonas alkaliphilus TaxID=2588942 RepID=A0A554WB93_9BURK|nr:Uma2 family endonuclease [Tepidimonas alkaliphilus]TSE20841.1 putative restriction endonuclease [Tepidimonas alkaliphilus]
MRVAVEAAQHWFYPDVVVTCDPQDLDDPDATALRAPVLVLEVLSPSTAAYDRGEKFLSLQRLPSVREYALLDPARLRLEVFRRNAEGRFERHVVEGVQAEAELTSVGWRGPLSALLG